MSDNIDFNDLRKRAVSQPLVVDKYTADPSAHVFDGKIYHVFGRASNEWAK